MEDVLDVYHRDFDDDTVRVYVDEVSKQLTREVRTAVPMEPGRPARVDCEYERNGTANLFMVCAPLLGWRHVKVTERRTTADFATLLANLTNVHFPDRKVVLDRQPEHAQAVEPVSCLSAQEGPAAEPPL